MNREAGDAAAGAAPAQGAAGAAAPNSAAPAPSAPSTPAIPARPAPPDEPAQPAEPAPRDRRHVIVVGFGLAGRAVVNNVIEHGVSYTVIENNADVVERCLTGGLHIIRGDARNADLLRQAGIERATEVAVTVPGDEITLAVVEQARKLNATARIIARCTFVSGGMEAVRLGADDTVIAEQVVATEFGHAINAALAR